MRGGKSRKSWDSQLEEEKNPLVVRSLFDDDVCEREVYGYTKGNLEICIKLNFQTWLVVWNRMGEGVSHGYGKNWKGKILWKTTGNNQIQIHFIDISSSFQFIHLKLQWTCITCFLPFENHHHFHYTCCIPHSKLLFSSSTSLPVSSFISAFIFFPLFLSFRLSSAFSSPLSLFLSLLARLSCHGCCTLLNPQFIRMLPLHRRVKWKGCTGMRETSRVSFYRKFSKKLPFWLISIFECKNYF